jgi:hypothetical protein
VIEAALQEVLMTGASCAVISDESMPDDPRFAWHFRGRIETPTPPSNYAAISAICHQIASMTSRKAIAERPEHLRRTEEINARLRRTENATTD